MAKQAIPTSPFVKSLRTMKLGAKAEHAEALLLTCIDFRFFAQIAAKLASLGLAGKYDHCILAGASLGAQLDFDDRHLPPSAPPPPLPIVPRLHWQQVFIEHLILSTTLHATIKRVIVVEHRDCGAYKAFLKPGGYPTPAAERAAHRRQAKKLAKLIHRFRPRLRVEAWLASLKPPKVGPLMTAAKASFEDLVIEKL